MSISFAFFGANLLPACLSFSTFKIMCHAIILELLVGCVCAPASMQHNTLYASSAVINAAVTNEVSSIDFC